MLVLSRRQQESILISDDVVITVLAIRGSSVKIGIEAPRDTRVIRSELTPAGMKTLSLTLPRSGLPPR